MFSDWLKGIDKEMAKKKRRILLFINNCNAHSNFLGLKNITVKFLPPNTTSKLQPLDQGIIRSFKVGYRAQIVRRLLDSIGEGKPCASINILRSMRMADYAWRNVTETIIKNCFIKVGFSENKTSRETEEVDSINHSIGEREINPEQWASIQKDCDISFEDFLDVDNELQTCGTMTDKGVYSGTPGWVGRRHFFRKLTKGKVMSPNPTGGTRIDPKEIVTNINAEISDEENEELDQQEHEKVTVKEAEKAVELLRSVLESIEIIGNESFGVIATLEKNLCSFQKIPCDDKLQLRILSSETAKCIFCKELYVIKSKQARMYNTILKLLKH
ncbi:Tigger transposable element-derived protein 6 [Araneus ventricosus]|uniref:Tigger transposable element-derived protein 6 n=1 Tax=Araneus ventricosus TaxID=182803 RepID=A0A4Y2J2T7_ARAVE|nr:Tigger transposable element-derived protein 6 [Araneus ventricosus]